MLTRGNIQLLNRHKKKNLYRKNIPMEGKIYVGSSPQHYLNK